MRKREIIDVHDKSLSIYSRNRICIVSIESVCELASTTRTGSTTKTGMQVMIRVPKREIVEYP